MKYFFSLMIVAASVASVNASVADWTAFTPSTGTGDLDGITIDATSSAGAPIVGIVSGQFGSQWDGASPLGPDALGLTVSSVNAGDMQTFTFSSPLLDGTTFYIENFDSSSIADITFVGATGHALVDSSPSISMTTISPSSATLMTSNADFNGEGDAAIELMGPVSEIQISYSSGVGANGVFYTFSAPDVAAVPEPTSAMVMAGLFGIGGTVVCIRRRRQK